MAISKNKNIVYTCCVTVMLLFICAPQSNAGLLGDFESDIRITRHSTHQHNYQHGNRHRLGYGVIDMLYNIISNVVSVTENFPTIHGSHSSANILHNHRAQPLYDEDEANRDIHIAAPYNSYGRGSYATNSYVRLNISTQHIREDVDGIDASIAIRGRYFGLEFRHTQYAEEFVDETLDVNQVQGFYRLTPHHKNIDIDFGIGYGQIDGNDNNSGLILSLPVLIDLGSKVEIEIRPLLFNTQETTIHELDSAILFPVGNVAAIRFGYRSLSSPHYEIDGPYFGLSLKL